MLLAAELHEGGPDGVDGDERERRPRPLDLVEEDELVDGPTALPAELGGPAQAEPAVDAHPADDGAGLGVALAGVTDLGPHLGGQQAGEVLPELLAQGPLFVGVLEKHRTCFNRLPPARIGPVRPRASGRR